MPPRTVTPLTRVLSRGLPQGMPRDVVTMSAVAFCVALGFGVVAPAIPLFAKQFGVSAAAAGAVVSAFALLRLLSGLGAGRLVDWLGERLGLALGIGVVAVSSLLAGLSQSYDQLLVLRGIGGVGSAVFGVAAVSQVLRVAGKRMRGQAMSVYRSGFLLGGIVGPAFGGAVLAISLRAPFFLYAGTLTLAGVVALVFLRDQPPPSYGEGSAPYDAAPAGDTEPAPDPATSPAEPEPTLASVLRTREYQAALTTNLAVGLAVFGMRSTVVPLLIVHGLGYPDWWAGIAFLVSALVQTALMLPIGRWTDTVGRRPMLLLGAAVSVAGLALLGYGGTLWLVMTAMCVFGAGSAFLGTVPGALVGDVAGRRSGTVVAVFNMASDLGAVIGPVLAGWLVDQGSYGAAFGLGAVVVAVAGLLGLRLPRR
ncbi:MAG TPA: MFS transporter [Nocardioidaceae bacterium]|nr:MFS transporter [Nocardioidaceae bacterium]